MSAWARLIVASILLLSAFRLLVFRLSDFLPSYIPLKDSAFFVKKYEFFSENGWYESIAAGASPVFNALIWVSNLFFNDPYQSMKALSMASIIGTILIWFYFGKSVLKISARYSYLLLSFLIYLTFYTEAFFSGTNDGLFCFLIGFGLVCLFKSIIENSIPSFLCSAFLFSLAFGTREIFVFYLPGILLIILFLMIFRKFNFKSVLGYFFVFALTTIALYFPTLAENGTFKFADKNEGVGNWAEKNYLQVYLGENRITFEEVKAFKSSNPDIILPQTYSEAIFLNLKLTISNFVRQVILIQKPFVWQIGILFLIFLGLAFWNIKNGNLLDSNVLALVLFITFTLSFSILLINRVEFRWFMVFPFLFSVISISFIDKRTHKAPYLEYLFLANCLIISFLNFFLLGVWK